MTELITAGREIRELEPEVDWPAYAELLRVLHDGELSSGDVASILKRIAQYPYYKIFLAAMPESGAIVGTFTLIVIDNLGHGGTGFAVVDNVVVAPGRHGQGIGRWMMEQAMEFAKEQGCYKLMLSSSLKREGAHRFYEELGFVRHGHSFLIELQPDL